MADNLTTQSTTPATVPASTQIATDDVAGVHYQRVKLVDGTLDSSTGIPGDATNGLDVDVTRVQGTVNVSDAGGSLTVDDGGGSLTVDGTVSVSGTVTTSGTVTGSGTAGLPSAGVVTVQGITSGTPLSVSGPLTDAQLRATAVPVSIGSTVTTTALTDTQLRATAVPVSVSGVATAAKQPALGTAGTPSTDVISIQGVASGTVVPVSDGAGSLTVDNNGTFQVQVSNAPNVSNSGTFATQATTATPTTDTVLQNAVSANANGASLNVTGYGVAMLQISGSFTATISFEASIDAGANWTPISATQVGAVDIATTTTSTGLFRIACAGVDLIRARVTWTSGTSVTVVGRATNATLSNKLIKLASGTNAIGTVDTELPAAAALADGASNPTAPIVGAGSLLYNGSTWDRARGDTTNGMWVNVKNTPAVTISGTPTVSLSGTTTVTQTPATSGGLSLSSTLSTALAGTATAVKTSAGQVFGWVITNTSASVRYVKFYNATSATAGSGTPVLRIMVPGSTTGAGVVAAEFVNGIAFSTGISFTIVSGVADSDATNISANEVIVNVMYK